MRHDPQATPHPLRDRRPRGPSAAAGLLVLAILCPGDGGAAVPRTEPPVDASDAAHAVLEALADSGLVLVDTTLYYAEPIDVVGEAITWVTAPGTVALDPESVTERDADSVADLGPLLPATRVGTNSRGETLLMIRGAPERHTRILLDGIPLNVPWDERADLSMIPADAVGAVRARLGPGSVMDGLNALAGTVDLLPPVLPRDGRRVRLSLLAGEASHAEGRLLWLERRGGWSWLAAASRRERAGFVVPEDAGLSHHQGASRRRTNSDLEQGALFLRGTRILAGGGRLRLTLAGLDGSKGVPPEGHLETDARFWRYPVLQRALCGLGADLPLDEAGTWELRTHLAADVHRLEIRSFDDATYTTPLLAPGVEYETDRDRTGYARVRLIRRLGGGSLGWQVESRYAHHRETLEIGGPELTYAQWLGSAVMEGEVRPAAGWDLRGGGGWEFAATPESGDKPARERTDAAVLHLRASHRPRAGAELFLNVSRRSRFPSLRELYSGALGRFVPNPDLRPERQDALELGAVLERATWRLGVTGFGSRLDGAIERIVLPDGSRRFQRVNLDRLRTLGVELIASWRPGSAWSLTAHHTIMNVRRQVDGAYAAPVEDRPDYLSMLSAAWRSPAGCALLAELIASGPRSSADVLDGEDGLRRLPAQAILNLRAAWSWRTGLVAPSRLEAFVRVNNVLDRTTWSQTGLVEPGRALLIGVSAALETGRSADAGS